MTPDRSRRFAWLALVAMLSLALLPTFGRLGAGVAADGGMPADHAMPSPMSGFGMAMAVQPHMQEHVAARSLHPLPPHSGHAVGTRASGERPGGSHEGHGGHDCTYCLLLAGLVGATTVQWRLPAPFIPGHRATPAFTNRRIDAPVPALGGQGPPSGVMG